MWIFAAAAAVVVVVVVVVVLFFSGFVFMCGSDTCSTTDMTVI